MTVRLPTASSLDRAVTCSASFLLPQQDNDAAPSEGRERGRAIARYLQRIPQIGADAALAEVPSEWVEVCASIDLEALPITLGTEVAFALNCVSGDAVELGRDIDRNYEPALLAVRPDADVTEWVFGTADVFGVSELEVFVGDHKGHQRVERAKANRQLGFSAVCAAKVYGRKRAVVCVYRPLQDGRPPDRAELDEFDLEAFEYEVRALHWQAKEFEAGRLALQPVPGVHCRYCKATNECPAAKVGAEIACRSDGQLDPRGPITRENAGRWYVGLAALREWMRNAEAQIEELARYEPIELPDGRRYGLTEVSGNERIDSDIALSIIGEELGPEIANDASTRTITKKGLARALQKHNVPGRGRVAEQIWEKVRKAGGASSPVSKGMREF